MTDAQRTELARRLAAHRADPTAARPWDEVEAELLARIDRGGTVVSRRHPGREGSVAGAAEAPAPPAEHSEPRA